MLYFEMEQDKDTHRENQNIRERNYEKACKQKQALCVVQMWKMINRFCQFIAERLFVNGLEIRLGEA